MSIKTPFMLEKLTITAYKDIAHNYQVGQPFMALFNPESYSEKYDIHYFKPNTIHGKSIDYKLNEPRTLSFKLVLDGTGSHKVGALQLLTNKTVTEKIKHLQDICFNINGKIHEPNYLVVAWGKLNFPCRLSSLDINYTSFNPDGTPLRADLSVSFIFAQEKEKQAREEDKQSPDITHSHIVKNGDTLPLLSKAVYGSVSHYLWIAEQNQLDDFRNLIPGKRLFFPPLVS